MDYGVEDAVIDAEAFACGGGGAGDALWCVFGEGVGFPGGEGCEEPSEVDVVWRGEEGGDVWGCGGGGEEVGEGGNGVWETGEIYGWGCGGWRGEDGGVEG